MEDGNVRKREMSLTPLATEPDSIRQINFGFATRHSANSGDMNMAFVNEYIPEADVEKYGLKKIDAKAPAVTVKSRDWTIDREREIYLRQITTYRDDMENVTKWNFFWRGELLWFDKRVLEATGKRRGPVWAHIQIKNFEIPAQLEAHRNQIYQDLHEAILAYRDGGVFDASTEFSMQLDIDG